jgi:hypothetical protein
MLPEARAYADLPGGHSEGYDDAHKMVNRRFYRTVADRNARWSTRPSRTACAASTC